MNSLEPGQLITFTETQFREVRLPVINRYIAVVERVVDDVDRINKFVIFHVVRHFCFVEGHHEHGRFLPKKYNRVYAQEARYLSEVSPLFF